MKNPLAVDWADAVQPESQLRKLTFCNPGTNSENLLAVKAEING